MSQKQLQIPRLMQAIDNFVFQRYKHLIRYEYPLEVKKQFRMKYKMQPYHNPLMALAIYNGLIPDNTRYMSLSKYDSVMFETEVLWINDRNIVYNPFRNELIDHHVVFYYDPFITYLFLHDKLEEYIGQYSRRVKEWGERETNNCWSVEETKGPLKYLAS